MPWRGISSDRITVTAKVTAVRPSQNTTGSFCQRKATVDLVTRPTDATSRTARMTSDDSEDDVGTDGRAGGAPGHPSPKARPAPDARGASGDPPPAASSAGDATGPTAQTPRHGRGEPLSAVLQRAADAQGRDRVTVGDLLDALGDRALAALIFLFAFPNVLPMPPGTSAVLGVPLIILALQLMTGRRPWLPAVLARRSMARDDLVVLVRRIQPFLHRAERMLGPRLEWLARPPMEYLLGLACVFLGLLVALPIPLGNMLPALAISLLALGILERDGLWVMAGLVTGVAAALFVSGVVFAMTKAAIYFFTRVLT